ncbi:MAG TPA: zf-HC2 domain-containing protein [Gaiellales bacterium]|nr:zf-HC2 domain-containing protein [Gaiellales bacterium]
MTTGHRIRFRSLDRRCLETREAISAELDGEVSALEAAAARRHREQCDDCDRFAAAIAETTAAVRAAPGLTVPSRPVRLTRRVGRRVTMVGGLAAAMAVSAVLGAGVASHLSGHPRQPQPQVIYVANGEPDRVLIAREQMLIRRTFGQQASLRHHQRLG